VVGLAGSWEIGRKPWLRASPADGEGVGGCCLSSLWSQAVLWCVCLVREGAPSTTGITVLVPHAWAVGPDSARLGPSRPFRLIAETNDRCRIHT